MEIPDFSHDEEGKNMAVFSPGVEWNADRVYHYPGARWRGPIEY